MITDLFDDTGYECGLICVVVQQATPHPETYPGALSTCNDRAHLDNRRVHVVGQRCEAKIHVHTWTFSYILRTLRQQRHPVNTL